MKGRFIMKIYERLNHAGYLAFFALQTDAYAEVIRYIPKEEFDNFDVPEVYTFGDKNLTEEEIIYNQAVKYYCNKYFTKEFRFFVSDNSIVSSFNEFVQQHIHKLETEFIDKTRFEIFSQNTALYDKVLKEAQRWTEIYELAKSYGVITPIEDTGYPKNVSALLNAFEKAGIKYTVSAYKKENSTTNYIGYKVTVNNVTYEFSKEFGGRLDNKQSPYGVYSDEYIANTFKFLTKAFDDVGIGWYIQLKNTENKTYSINIGETSFIANLVDGKVVVA